MRPLHASLALVTLWAIGCQSTEGNPEAPPTQANLQPASAAEAALRDLDRPREKLDRKKLQGAWSVFKTAGRRAPALGGDHPVLIVKTAPDLALGDLVFLGAIEVRMGTGRPGFDWETANTHLKGRAQEHGADLVLLAKVKRDPVGLGLRQVVGAAYRYVSPGIR